MSTTHHPIVSRAEWLAARKQLLTQEKQLSHDRDRLAEQRRNLPWVQVTERYELEGPDGKTTLAELFDGRSQLVIYHFMFGPDWKAGCKSCSFWADGFDGIAEHLKHRDVSFAAISRGPLAALSAFAARLGWRFRWYSSENTTFNHDYNVSFTEQELATGDATYNFGTETPRGTESPGISVFYKDPAGTIFHTYSCYSRGLDMMNLAYQFLDLVPKGRDEAGLSFPMAWVRHRDSYGV